MGTGAVHWKVYKRWLWFAGLISLVFVPLSPFFSLGIFIGYFIISRYLSSDADLVAITSEEGRMMKELKIFGVFLVAYFLPYAYICRYIGWGRKGHRNFFSHFPVVATIIRLAYILIVPAGMAIYFKYQVPEQTYPMLYGVLFGMSLHDCLHYYYDFFKKSRKLW